MGSPNGNSQKGGVRMQGFAGGWQQQQAAASAAGGRVQPCISPHKGSQVQEGERLVHCNVGRGVKLRERKRRPATGKCGFSVKRAKMKLAYDRPAYKIYIRYPLRKCKKASLREGDGIA